MISCRTLVTLVVWGFAKAKRINMFDKIQHSSMEKIWDKKTMALTPWFFYPAEYCSCTSDALIFQFPSSSKTCNRINIVISVYTVIWKCQTGIINKTGLIFIMVVISFVLRAYSCIIWAYFDIHYFWINGICKT